MARTQYPGLTRTENARRAKHDYQVTASSEKRTCIVFYSDWVPVMEPDGSVKPENNHSVYHIKDAHTGELLDVDTRLGGSVTRCAPTQMSWFH